MLLFNTLFIGALVNTYLLLNLDEQLVEGSLDGNLSYLTEGMAIPIMEETLMACDFLSVCGWPCPINPGHVQLWYSALYPDVFPAVSEVCRH